MIAAAIAGGVLLLSRSASAFTTSASVTGMLPGWLKPRQRENARIIESVVRANVQGASDQLVMAMIANAYRESGLDAGAKGDSHSGSPHSFGLFQCNLAGLGKDLEPAYLLDPENNTLTVIKRGLMAKPGRKTMQMMDDGASAEELADRFCRDVESPGDKDGEAKKSTKIVADLFGVDTVKLKG
jgi:hypothetical protein